MASEVGFHPITRCQLRTSTFAGAMSVSSCVANDRLPRRKATGKHRMLNHSEIWVDSASKQCVHVLASFWPAHLMYIDLSVMHFYLKQSKSFMFCPVKSENGTTQLPKISIANNSADSVCRSFHTTCKWNNLLQCKHCWVVIVVIFICKFSGNLVVAKTCQILFRSTGLCLTKLEN